MDASGCKLVLAFLCTVLLSLAKAEIFDLTLLHTGYVRGEIMPISSSNAECTVAQAEANYGGDCTGGAARRHAYIKKVRAQSNATLVVDVGSYFWGTLFYNKFGGSAAADYINAGYDVVNVGLTDVHGGAQVLADYTDDIDPSIPVMNCNIQYSDDPFLGKPRRGMPPGTPRFNEWWVTEVQGRKVGFVGMLGDDVVQTAALWSTFQVDVNATSEDLVRLAVLRMKKAHPDLNIIIGVLDGRVNTMLERLYDIDIVVNVDTGYIIPARKVDNGGGPYPRVVTNGLGEKLLYLNAGQMGNYIGHFKVSFDDDGIPLRWDGDAILLDNNTIAPDPAMWAKVKQQYSEVQTVLGVAVGSTTDDIFGLPGDDSTKFGSRWSDSPMGRIVTDGLLYYCQDCDVALWNSGNIRASILMSNLKNGTIALKDVYTVHPFQNLAVTFSTRGSTIVQMLQNGVSMGGGFGRFLQVAKMRYAWNNDKSVPPSERLLEVEVYDAPSDSYVPINPQQYYKVVSNSFMLDGGDGFTMIRPNAVNIRDLGPTDAESLASYIRYASPITAVATDVSRSCLNAPLPLKKSSQCRIVATNLTTALTTCPSNAPFCSRYLSDQIVDGLFVGDFNNDTNTWSCGPCSGLGKCQDLACTCKQPTTGLYTHITMVRGEDCSDVRSVYVISQNMKIGLDVLAAFVILSSLGLGVTLAVLRHHSVIKASSPLFGGVLCLGGIIGAVSVIVMLEERSEATCSVSFWLFCVAFILVFAPLFAKTYRMDKIFNADKIIDQDNLNDWSLMRMVGVCLFVDVLVLLLFTLTAPLKPEGRALSDWSVHAVCSSNNASSFYGILIGFKGLLVLWGIYLAFRTRNIPIQTFNESRNLALAIYNLAVAAAVILPVIYAFGSDNPTFFYVVYSVVVCYVILFTELVMYVPRFIKVYRGENEANPFAAQQRMESSQKVMQQRLHGMEARLLAMEDEMTKCGQHDKFLSSRPVYARGSSTGSTISLNGSSSGSIGYRHHSSVGSRQSSPSVSGLYGHRDSTELQALAPAATPVKE